MKPNFIVAVVSKSYLKVYVVVPHGVAEWRTRKIIFTETVAELRNFLILEDSEKSGGLIAILATVGRHLAYADKNSLGLDLLSDLNSWFLLLQFRRLCRRASLNPKAAGADQAPCHCYLEAESSQVEGIDWPKSHVF